MTTKQTTRHTPEPWFYEMAGPYTEGSELFVSEINDGDSHGTNAIAFAFGDSLLEANKNAGRIVECVNACKGLPDPSVVPELVSMVRQLSLRLQGVLEFHGATAAQIQTHPDLCRARAILARAETAP